MKIQGSCLCKSVKYEVSNAECLPIGNCHCENCRKTHGAAFGSYLAFKKADFHWLTGESAVTRFESSPKTYRCFCSLCGSPLVAFDDQEVRCITMGSTDGNTGLQAEYHMYVSSKAPWHEITDDLPQFQLRSPETRPPLDTNS